MIEASYIVSNMKDTEWFWLANEVGRRKIYMVQNDWMNENITKIVFFIDILIKKGNSKMMDELMEILGMLWWWCRCISLKRWKKMKDEGFCFLESIYLLLCICRVVHNNSWANRLIYNEMKYWNGLQITFPWTYCFFSYNMWII